MMDYGVDQNVGITGSQTQADVAVAEMAQTAVGLSLLVGVVADAVGTGEESARLARGAVAALLKGIREGKSEHPGELLAAAFERTHRAAQRQGNGGVAVSLTAVVIHNNRLYLAHAGHTRAYLARGGQLQRLTQDDGQNGYPTHAIGMSGDLPLRPPITGGDSGGLRLQTGDHLLLCTDGLVKERPDGKGVLLTDQEIIQALNDSSTPALETARTLVSLSVGRKADDNVSAVVISMPPPRKLNMWALAAGAVVALLLLAFLATSLMGGRDQAAGGGMGTAVEPTVTAPPTATPIPDVGDLFVLAGSGLVSRQEGTEENVMRGGAARAGDRVRVGADAMHLQLKGGGDLYLAANSDLRLDVLERADLLGERQLTLLDGALLLQQINGGQKTLVFAEGENLVAAVEGIGLFGVRKSGAAYQVVCFSGGCGAGERPLPAGQSALVTPDGAVSGDPAPLDDTGFWQALCPGSDCLP